MSRANGSILEPAGVEIFCPDRRTEFVGVELREGSARTLDGSKKAGVNSKSRDR